jgi:hypothetical protein
MGILDDAIREHLDLKRQQGAADDELKRLEDEAFGPPSRPGDPDFPEQQAAVETQAPEAPPVELDEELEVDEPEEPEALAAEEPALEEPEPAAPADEDALFDQSSELDLELDLDEPIEEVADLDVAEPEPAPGEDAPIETLPTVEHHFEDAIDEAEVVDDEPEAHPAEDSADSEDDGDDEDVLEETPEFLRDAPEDDELWFEQGEPKDFDF